MNPGHQPERFQVFEEIPGERAFTISGTQFVFRFDRDGGWFDQHGNYYNTHGEPDEPPSESESCSSESEERSEDSGDESDQYEKEFGRPKNMLEDDHDQETNLQALASNLEILQDYPKGSNLRVYFENVGHHTKRAEIMEAYGKEVKGILTVILDRKGNTNKGTGYFIMADSESAGALIHCEGRMVCERALFFDVEKHEDLLAEPISEEELKRTELPKFMPREVQKMDNTQSMPWCWCWYKFEKDIFPKQSGFKQWMLENGLNLGTDFKGIEKLQDDPEKRHVKVEMKDTTFKSINGSEFKGRKVHFIPLQ